MVKRLDYLVTIIRIALAEAVNLLCCGPLAQLYPTVNVARRI